MYFPSTSAYFIYLQMSMNAERRRTTVASLGCATTLRGPFGASSGSVRAANGWTTRPDSAYRSSAHEGCGSITRAPAQVSSRPPHSPITSIPITSTLSSFRSSLKINLFGFPLSPLDCSPSTSLTFPAGLGSYLNWIWCSISWCPGYYDGGPIEVDRLIN